MVTEEILASYSLDELMQLLRARLASFEQLESGPRSIKESELARIELDLIEWVIDERKKIQK